MKFKIFRRGLPGAYIFADDERSALRAMGNPPSEYRVRVLTDKNEHAIEEIDGDEFVRRCHVEYTEGSWP